MRILGSTEGPQVNTPTHYNDIFKLVFDADGKWVELNSADLGPVTWQYMQIRLLKIAKATCSKLQTKRTPDGDGLYVRLIHPISNPRSTVQVGPPRPRLTRDDYAAMTDPK
jgi:hypothetical protein